MKSKRIRKMIAMLLALLTVFNFSALNLLAEDAVPETIAVPGSSAVAVGTTVILSCSTDGTFIWYSINEGEYVEYDPVNKIILETLPVSLKAYAEKDGQTGEILTINYTQAQVSVVAATPVTGAVNVSTEVYIQD